LAISTPVVIGEESHFFCSITPCGPTTPPISREVSAYYVAEEIAMTHRGMMIAIPQDEWVVFQEMTPSELAGALVALAAAVRLPAYRKHPRGPKKPKPKKRSGAKIKHVATAKVLASRQRRTR
jgi:hypothetical protein